jgi:predicted S18 family serine protease
MHPPNPDEAHSILYNVEDEEMVTEQRKLKKELWVAQKEVSQVKNSLVAVDITIINVANNLVALQHAVSDAKQEAQHLMNELAVANAVEADTAAAFERATAQVKGIDRSQKSMHKQAKWARQVAKAEMDVAAEQLATISHQSSNATWTLHEWEKAGHPLHLEEAQVKTQNASLVMKLADADKVL